MSRPIVTANLQDVVRTLVDHPARWLGPTFVAAVICLGYVLVRPNTWEASQALVVRDETSSKPDRPGRFERPEEMKTVQETILELARSRSVMREALLKVGPAPGTAEENFPDEKTISALQGNVKITPPKGLEFGKTEMFYLKVQAKTPERAIALDNAICERLQAHFQQLRNSKAQGLVDELSKTVELAQAQLETSTARLTALEKEIGGDLAEMRMLNESPSGDSNLRRIVVEIENELRQTRSIRQTETELLSVLTAAQADPNNLLATPNKLLESQPSLRRLKDGLLEAQLHSAQLAGTMSKSHPQVSSAHTTEKETRQQLHSEIAAAIEGLQIESKITNERLIGLEKQMESARTRLNSLAAIRAEYGNLVSDVKQRTDILKNAQQALSDGQASLAASRVSSMITRVDLPDIGGNPVGPSRGQTVLLGTCCGLILGLGILFLTTSPRPMFADAASLYGAEQEFASPLPQEAFATGHGGSLKQALQELGPTSDGSR